MVSFWMRKFGHISFKRTMVLSNLEQVGILDRGPLTSRERQGTVPTVNRWINSSGKQCFVGNAFLKETQMLD